MAFEVEKLPADLNAERWTLASMLINREVAPQGLAALGIDDFSSRSHRWIFAAMRKLDREKHAIEPLTVGDELRTAGKLDEVGGLPYLAELMAGMGRYSDISESIRLIKNASQRRKLAYLGNWLTDEAMAPDADPMALLASLQQKVDGIAESSLIDDLVSNQSAVDRTMAQLEEQWSSGRSIVGLSTGYEALDQALGGIKRGNYYVLAAGPGLGKTTLAFNWASHFLKADPEAVGLAVSLEMGVEELTLRALAGATRIDSVDIERGNLNDDEKDAVRMAAERIRRMSLEYAESFRSVTARSIAGRVARVRKRYGRIDFLIVDYIQLMDGDKEHETANARITEISRALKRIATTYNIPVIVLSQLNREHTKRTGKGRDYQLGDIRESGSIAQDADVVLFLMPDDWDDPESNMRRVVISKQRGGQAPLTVKLVFLPKYCCFEPETYGQREREKHEKWASDQDWNDYRND